MVMTATVISPTGRREVDHQQGSEQPTHPYRFALVTGYRKLLWVHGFVALNRNGAERALSK
jgi:hypothetical protein